MLLILIHSAMYQSTRYRASTTLEEYIKLALDKMGFLSYNLKKKVT